MDFSWKIFSDRISVLSAAVRVSCQCFFFKLFTDSGNVGRGMEIKMNLAKSERMPYQAW
jgi:hypothetical protein